MYRLRLAIFVVDIDGTLGSCAGDFLRVQRIAGGNVDVCGMMTSTNPTPFFSDKEEIVIRFQSNTDGLNGRGFFFRLQGKQNEI